MEKRVVETLMRISSSAQEKDSRNLGNAHRPVTRSAKPDSDFIEGCPFYSSITVNIKFKSIVGITA